MLTPRLDQNRLPVTEHSDTQPFENKERFTFFASNENLPNGNAITYYHSGTSQHSHFFHEHGLQLRIKIGKSGLYHFSINTHVMLTDSAPGILEFLLRDFDANQNYVQGFTHTLGFKGSYDKETEFYISAGKTFSFEPNCHNNKNTNYSLVTIIISGFLISQ